MYSVDWMLYNAVIGGFVLLLGLVLGIGAMLAREERAEKRQIRNSEFGIRNDHAPVPDLGYDPTNPINGGGRREAVEIDGMTWYRMN